VLVSGVLAHLTARGYDRVEEAEAVLEDVQFGLPKELLGELAVEAGSAARPHG
jgi:hypothetical protein